MKPLFSNIIAIECRSASAIRQKLSILVTQERAAGALIDRQRSAGFFEIRRMTDYGMSVVEAKADRPAHNLSGKAHYQ
jgi:hypothetical protein